MKIRESHWRYCGESDQTGYFLTGMIEEYDGPKSRPVKGSPPEGWALIYQDATFLVFRRGWMTIIIHKDGNFTASRAESKEAARTEIGLIASWLTRES